MGFSRGNEISNSIIKEQKLQGGLQKNSYMMLISFLWTIVDRKNKGASEIAFSFVKEELFWQITVLMTWVV